MRNYSIAGKLLFAFSAIAVLSLVAAMVGFQGFQRVADTQNSVIDTAVPVLRQTHSLTELNTRIGSLARGIAEVDNEEDRQRLSADLSRQIRAFGPVLEGIRTQGFAEEYLDQMDSTVSAISRIISRQDALVEHRNKEKHRVEDMSQRLIAATTELNELSGSLVANAAATTTAVVSSLYDLVQSNSDRNELFAVFDRLVEIDIDAMERMYELRSRSSSLGAIVSRVRNETSREELSELETEAVGIVTILGRRINEINDPQRKARASALLELMQLTAGPINVKNVFKTRRAYLDAAAAIDQLDAEYRAMAERLNGIVGELADSAGAHMTLATGQAKTSLTTSRRLFIFIAIVCFLVMILIFWRYIHRRVIRRLLDLRDATLAIAGGAYDHAIDAEGADEVGQMAQALQRFRDNAVDKRRLDAELRAHKENLERLVKERTVQLEQANAELAKEVALHDVAREKAEQANRAKTDFLATISHELRTPLSGALGTLRLLNDTRLEPTQREYLKAVDAANSVLLDILDNVLGYSQARAGKLVIRNVDFGPRHLLSDIANLMTASIEEHQNTLSIRIDERIPEMLHGDSGKISQILLNLIGNAAKFTTDGKIDLHADLLENGEENARIRFSVQDTGIGVSAEKQTQMFHAFTQADTSISRKYGGIGLGLSICKKLTEALGGTIDLASAPGEGTRVSVTLPLQKVAAESVQVAEQTLIDALPAKKVLLVEDDETNRFVVNQYLKLMRHEVVVAKDGEQALARLKEVKVDIVLLDVSLPGIDGLTVIKTIRTDPHSRTLPVIAMSAHVFSEEVETYLRAGMNGFLGKPFSLEELRRAMYRVLVGESGVMSVCRARQLDDVVVDETVIKEDIECLGVAKVKELADLFKRNSERALDEIRVVVENSDSVAVRKIAHRLRSSAGNFGFHRLCNLLLKMELESEDTDNLRRNYSRLPGQLSASLAALEVVTDSLTGSRNM